MFPIQLISSMEIITIVIIVAIVGKTQQHGMLMEPCGRASRWRCDTTSGQFSIPNYNDNGLNCGGYLVSSQSGRCGICGDSYYDKRPRPHELGGIYGQGTIVKNYNNQFIEIGAKITANHLGYYYIEICNLDKFLIESEDCFKEYGPLRLADGTTQLRVGRRSGFVNTTVLIPLGLTCRHCVLRWSYIAGNNWGICDNGRGGIGCGSQEMFKSCADISIRSLY